MVSKEWVTPLPKSAKSKHTSETNKQKLTTYRDVGPVHVVLPPHVVRHSKPAEVIRHDGRGATPVSEQTDSMALEERGLTDALLAQKDDLELVRALLFWAAGFDVGHSHKPAFSLQWATAHGVFTAERPGWWSKGLESGKAGRSTGGWGIHARRTMTSVNRPSPAVLPSFERGQQAYVRICGLRPADPERVFFLHSAFASYSSGAHRTCVGRSREACSMLTLCVLRLLSSWAGHGKVKHFSVAGSRFTNSRLVKLVRDSAHFAGGSREKRPDTPRRKWNGIH